MLTTAQKTILKAAIAADPVLSQYPNNSDGAFDISRKLDEIAVPEFVVWKTNVHKNEVGKAFQATALAAITSGNSDKLANFAAWNDVVDPSRADQRAFFDDVFSVAAGATTRTSLLALWKRPATRAEKIFAVGTGTTLAPATMVVEGTISPNDIFDARSM